MNSNNAYYNWFKKVIAVFIELFFVAASISALCVFANSFTGLMRYATMAVMFTVYGAVIYFYRDTIKNILIGINDSFEKLSTAKMIAILLALMIVLRLVYSFFFSFDCSTDGDIGIYIDFAQKTLRGETIYNAISHLYAMACHVMVFMYLHIPLTVGIFMTITLAVIINFISFKDIVGKSKAFMLCLLYVLMPSTMMLSFCPTHEVFLFLYISCFIFFLNKTIKSDNVYLLAIYSIAAASFSALSVFINPSGYMTYIIMFLLIVLSNLKSRKKIVIVVMLALSLLGSSGLSSFQKSDSHQTTINTYTILIHGTNAESLGEQVDGYPRDEMVKYVIEHKMEWTDENFEIAAKGVLINQCKYLLSNPLVLLKLICHKIYILYSGVHYPINMGYFYGAFGTVVYYLMLILNTLTYLFMITVGLVYRKKNEDDFTISNYKLVLLGNIGVTMLSIVVNKYSVYVTMFIYLIALYRADLSTVKKYDE